MCYTLGGEIGVESEAGKGSTFWFTALLKKQVKKPKASDKLPACIREKRFLIVDDIKTNRFVFSEYMKFWKCRFDAVENGPTALEYLRKAKAENDPYHLALLDMQMPEMDGASLGRQIKSDPEVADTMLVLLTSIGKRGDANRFKEIGFSAYLTKPVKQNQLYKALLTVFGNAAEEPRTAGKKKLVTQHTLRESEPPKACILLAEDNPVNQKLANKLLEKMGYRVDTVNNGKEAITALEKSSYDLVLMDVQMPEMGGYEATRYIRSPNTSVRNPNIPIIAMTAHTMPGDREKCLDCGMDDYVSKPINRNQFKEAIEKQLCRRNNAQNSSIQKSE